jgi:hypothetical protein
MAVERNELDCRVDEALLEMVAAMADRFLQREEHVLS